MSDHDENFQPEDDGSCSIGCGARRGDGARDDLFIVLDGSDICPKCGKQGGVHAHANECAFC